MLLSDTYREKNPFIDNGNGIKPYPPQNYWTREIEWINLNNYDILM